MNVQKRIRMFSLPSFLIFARNVDMEQSKSQPEPQNEEKKENKENNFVILQVYQVSEQELLSRI